MHYVFYTTLANISYNMIQQASCKHIISTCATIFHKMLRIYQKSWFYHSCTMGEFFVNILVYKSFIILLKSGYYIEIFELEIYIYIIGILALFVDRRK